MKPPARRKPRAFAAGCGGARLRLKPDETSELPMVGIGIVVLFLVVIGALNLYEFGRLD